MKIDAEFKQLLTPLTTDELAGLEASIVAEGCRDPLVTWQDILLDGHNRYEICQQLDIAYQTTDIELSDRHAAYNWIIANQLGKRNVTPEQASYLRGKRYNAEKQQGARTDLTSRQNGGKLLTAEKLAEQYKVSAHTVERDGKFADAIDKLVNIQGDKIRTTILARDSNLSKQDVVKLAAMPESEQTAVVQQLDTESTLKDALRAIRIKKQAVVRVRLAATSENLQPQERWQIIHGDLRAIKLDKQYDFIITDPPYPKEYLELYTVLAKRAKTWLKPDGLLVVMCGQSYVEQIYTMLSQYMDYYWTAAYLTPGQPTPLRQRQVNSNWKPLLIYTHKDISYKGKTFGDVFTSDKNEKELHEWGQSESGMYSIISQICLPGQSILDPFCGAGTTGIAALRHGCLFDGIDIDIESVKIARGRLHDETKK